MKVLVIAPHPFFRERGTPIDVLLLLRVLSERPGTAVDVLTLPEGAAVDLPNVTLTRTPAVLALRGVRPGFSLKKLVCFVFLFAKAWRMLRRTRYDLIHAGEEGAFIALVLGGLFKVPYAYDLDSSVAQQMIEQMRILTPLYPAFAWIERLAIRRSLICLPVCNALADLCMRAGARKIITLHDISQLPEPGAPATGFLKRELGVSGFLLVYVGNLERYQGVDLLLDSFQRAAARRADLFLAIIGGPARQRRYARRVARLGLQGRAFLLGPRPYAELHRYLAEADLLVCPRTRGLNTPMKIFAFLHAGRPVLATALPTHTQIIAPDIAMLAPATPDAFAAAMLRLADDGPLRTRLAAAGRAFVEANHTFDAHRRRVGEAYDWIERQLRCAAPAPAAPAPGTPLDTPPPQPVA